MKQKTTMSTKPLTQQQVDYIRAHANDRPRTKVARDAGVSMCTLYRIVREAGGEMRHDLSRRNREHWEIVRRCYPVMTTREIADKYGILYGRVNKIARELGVRHSQEVLDKQRAENMAKCKALRYKVDFAAIAAKRKRRKHYDELRVMSGLKPLTRLRLKAMPTKARKAKWHLCRKWGYTTADGEPYTLYYDGTTRRMDESYYTKKYGLKFKNYETSNDNLLENQELHAD